MWPFFCHHRVAEQRPQIRGEQWRRQNERAPRNDRAGGSTARQRPSASKARCGDGRRERSRAAAAGRAAPSRAASRRSRSDSRKRERRARRSRANAPDGNRPEGNQRERNSNRCEEPRRARLLELPGVLGFCGARSAYSSSSAYFKGSATQRSYPRHPHCAMANVSMRVRTISG